MASVIEKIKTLEGQEIEIVIKTLNAPVVAKVLGKYIDFTKNVEGNDVSKMLKDSANMMEFLNECFERGTDDNCKLENFSMGEVQRITTKHLDFILGMLTNEEIKN